MEAQKLVYDRDGLGNSRGRFSSYHDDHTLLASLVASHSAPRFSFPTGAAWFSFLQYLASKSPAYIEENPRARRFEACPSDANLTMRTMLKSKKLAAD